MINWIAHSFNLFIDTSKVVSQSISVVPLKYDLWCYLRHRKGSRAKLGIETA